MISNADSLLALVLELKKNRGLLLFLDYDGTLVEIAPRPELARPTPELLRLLARLVARPDYAVVVVSGRQLQDLQELLPIPGLNYIGSHGGEGLIDGNPWNFKAPPGTPEELGEMKKQLLAYLSKLSGWWLEIKPLGLALHYRQASSEEAARIIKTLEPWLAQVIQQGRYQILGGKKVVEILPQGVSKGAAITKILSFPGYAEFFPLYLGDDVTDESAFRVLKDKGLGIKVGRSESPTPAAYSLSHPAAVQRFLARLAAHPKNPPSRLTDI